MITPATSDLRDQMKRLAVESKPQLVVAEAPVQEPPRDVAPPPNGKQQPVPAERDTQRTAIDPVAQAKDGIRAAKQTYKQMKRTRFTQRHQRLMRGLPDEPIDIRALAYSVNTLGFVTVWLTHLYVNVRHCTAAHRAGFCMAAVRDERKTECATCDWGYTVKDAAYCKGCNCGHWIGARRTHKLRLAKFACPQGKFGMAAGWLRRGIDWVTNRPWKRPSIGE